MSDGIPRYTMSERIHHWIAGFAYTYCLVTGLAFWSPYLFWLSTLVGGGPTARFWHPWVGVVFAASTLWLYKIWRTDMRITEADRAWAKSMTHYVKNEDEQLPPSGRFNFGQKLYFWVITFSAILLLASGVGLWFVESIPAGMLWLRQVAIAVHVACALTTIGFFIIHVYMGTAMVRGAFDSMVSGEVSAAWARTHHRLWYDQISKWTTPPK